jgi:hypothetical protein
MSDEPSHWFAWYMDELLIQVKVCNGLLVRHYQIQRREIGVFDTMWQQLVSKGYQEVGYAQQEEEA